MQVNEKIDSCSCIDCNYFFNCQTDVDHEFCLTNPKALGYCELWGGPIKNTDPCHGFSSKKK